MLNIQILKSADNEANKRSGSVEGKGGEGNQGSEVERRKDALP